MIRVSRKLGLRKVSVQFSHSVVSNSLQPHGLQHARLPCPSPAPEACSNSCPLNWWCHPTISVLHRPLLLLPSVFPSIRVFSNESVLHIRWPKYWSFSFSIIPSSEYSGLISFRMNWLDLLAVQGTLKSLLQHHSSRASVLRHSTFFIVQLSHPYMTTGKIIALTRWKKSKKKKGWSYDNFFSVSYFILLLIHPGFIYFLFGPEFSLVIDSCS